MRRKVHRNLHTARLTVNVDKFSFYLDGNSEISNFDETYKENIGYWLGGRTSAADSRGTAAEGPPPSQLPKYWLVQLLKNENYLDNFCAPDIAKNLGLLQC